MPLVANGYQGQDCSLHADQKSGAARFPNGTAGIDAATADIKGMPPRWLVTIVALLNASHFMALVA